MKLSDLKYPLAIILAFVLPYIGYRISLTQHDFTYLGIGAMLAIFIAVLLYD